MSPAQLSEYSCVNVGTAGKHLPPETADSPEVRQTERARYLRRVPQLLLAEIINAIFQARSTLLFHLAERTVAAAIGHHTGRGRRSRTGFRTPGRLPRPGHLAKIPQDRE